VRAATGRIIAKVPPRVFSGGLRLQRRRFFRRATAHDLVSGCRLGNAQWLPNENPRRAVRKIGGLRDVNAAADRALAKDYRRVSARQAANWGSAGDRIAEKLAAQPPQVQTIL
jgi:hypothetical protein